MNNMAQGFDWQRAWADLQAALAAKEQENAELQEQVETWRTIARSRKNQTLLDTAMAWEAEAVVGRKAILQQADRADAAEARAEGLAAALEEIRRLTKNQSDVFLLRLSTIAVAALDAYRAEAPSANDGYTDGYVEG